MCGGQYEALAWLCGGLSFFAALGVAAAVNDKASKVPYVSIQFYFSAPLLYCGFPVLNVL